ncbi:MAG: hypothetical protein R3D00_18065 [Bacteroidia bacterium]
MSLFFSKYLRPVFFWIALSSQLFHVHTFFTYSGSDRNVQILAAINWLKGNGMTLPMASVSDISAISMVPVHGWPPGYSVAVAWVYQLVGNSADGMQGWFYSALLLEYLGVILVFAGAHVLLSLLRKEISPAVYPLFFLFWIFSFTPFHFTTASEEIALGVFLLATGAWVKGFCREKISGLWLAVAFAGFLFAGWFRYAYIPLMITGPAIGLVSAWRDTPERKKTALWATGIGFILMTGFWLILHPTHSQSGNLNDMVSGGKVHLENLLRMSAFPLKSLFFMGQDAIIVKLGIKQPLAVFIIRLLYVASTIGLMLFPLRMWRQHGNDFLQAKAPVRPVSTVLSAMFLVAILVVSGTLMLLSLVNPVEVYEGKTWTYVEETRYYAPLLVGLSMFLLVRLFDHDTSRMGRTALRFFLLSALLFGIGHRSFRYYSRFIKKDTRETRYDPENQFILNTCHYAEERVKNAGMPLVIARGSTFWEEDEAVVLAWTGVSMINFSHLLETHFESSRPIEILIRSGGSIRKSEIGQVFSEAAPPEQIISEPGGTLYRLMYLPQNALK